jgi:hypothetical protein
MSTVRYADMEAGRYLKARFGFEFLDIPELYPIQDALFAHAAEVARWRDALRREIRAMQEDFNYMIKSLNKGDLWYPLGDGPARNPYGHARKIEEAERHLKTWSAAVAKLQEAHGARPVAA